MMNQLTVWISGAALSLPSLGNLIDRFLDWIEELSAVTEPPAIDGLICDEVRSRVLLD